MVASFSELYTAVSQFVSQGKVGRECDEPSSLEFYSYTPTGYSRGDVLLNCCRGLVLHPVSGTIVTTPFSRFF